MRTRFLSLDAVILRSREQNEADAWVTLLAPVAGLLSGVAKNGLRSQKRFMGALIPGTHAQVLMARRQGVWYLEEALVDRPFARQKRHPLPYALACYGVEQVLATHPQGQQAADAYPLLVDLLEHLESPQADLPLTRLAWDLKLMESLGVPPHLADCVTCGTELTGRTHSFHGPSGGLLCPAHAGSQPALQSVGQAAIDFIGELMTVPLKDAPRATPRVRKEARALADLHQQWHLVAELRSRRVIEQLARRARP